MNERGASVLIEPDSACERDTLYPALSSADLMSAKPGLASAHIMTFVGGGVACAKPAILLQEK